MKRFVIFALCCLVVFCNSQTSDSTSGGLKAQLSLDGTAKFENEGRHNSPEKWSEFEGVLNRLAGNKAENNKDNQRQLNVSAGINKNKDNQRQLNVSAGINKNKDNQPKLNVSAGINMNKDNQPKLNVSAGINMNKDNQPKLNASAGINMNKDNQPKLNVSAGINMNKDNQPKLNVSAGVGSKYVISTTEASKVVQVQQHRPNLEDEFKNPEFELGDSFPPVTLVQPDVGSYTYEETEEAVLNISDTAPKNPEFSKDVCFPVVGCFSMNSPWQSLLRPIGAPQSPLLIQTKILFYSREHRQRSENITLYPEMIMGNARFDPKKKTAIIIHGFASSGDANWMRDMKDLYLKKYDANVMIVDWGKGAQALDYLQVASNTRVVGRQLAIFVKYLIENFQAVVKNFHVIGHSLGAHIGAYLGKEVRGIGRLTALDPAQPGFEGFSAEVQLDESDAQFVDVVHTDAKPIIPTLGFGMMSGQGHVDFYVNGGVDQPGCITPTELLPIKNISDLAKFPVEVISKIISCPHSRAYQYMNEAFNDTNGCILWGHKVNLPNVVKAVSNTITQGLLKKFTTISTKCTIETCVPMGFDTEKSSLRGTFVVTTNNKPPFCLPQRQDYVIPFPLGPVKPEFNSGSHPARKC